MKTYLTNSTQRRRSKVKSGGLKIKIPPTKNSEGAEAPSVPFASAAYEYKGHIRPSIRPVPYICNPIHIAPYITTFWFFLCTVQPRRVTEMANICILRPPLVCER